MKAYKRTLLTGVCMLWFCFRVMPQLCPSSALAPVFSQDFGQGTTALSTTAAVSGSTNYVFGAVGTDGNYVLSPSFDVSGKSDWTKLGDHTGNTFGNMFLVNAGGGKSIFFKQTVNGLCSGSTFNFSAWLANANTSSTLGVCGSGYKYPNVIFNIKNTGGTVLATYNTGNLPLSPVNGPANWQQYGFQFTLPVGTTSLVLEMVDFWGGAAACGNDLALDDILFTACTPQATISLSTGTTPICAGSSPVISTSLVNSPFTTPAYQWQKSTDNGVTWSNTGTAGTSANNFSFSNISTTDGGIYRVLVGPDVASLSSSSCITASSPITVTVYTTPTVTVSNNGPVCSGNTLTLTPGITGGTSPFSYTWGGPNSFSSTSATPSIASVVTAASGTYSLTLTDAQGCIATATSTLNVIATPVVNAISGTNGGCAGTNITVTNTTPSGVWSSSNSSVATITSTGLINLLAGGTTVISYSVTSNGCSASATKTVTTAQVQLPSDIIVCSGLIQFDQAPFTPVYSGSLGSDSYAWSMTATTGTVTYDPGSTPASQYPHVQFSNGSVYTVALLYTTSGISCSDTQLIYKNIIAADTIQTSHDTTICNSTALISLSGTASAVVNAFTWTSGGSGIFSNASGLQTDYTPSIADRAAGIIKIYLTASTLLGTTGSCAPGAPVVDSMILRITPPNTGTAAVQTICSGEVLNFTPVSSISGSTFSWSSAVTTGTATGNSVSGTGNIMDVLLNPSATANAVVTYTVTPSTPLPGGGNCAGTAFTFTVTISPVAVINAITATSCSGLAFTVTPVNGINGTVPAGTTYTWIVPAGAGFTGGLSQTAGVGNINGTLNNATNTSLTAAYSVTPVSGICTGAAFTVAVTVTPVNMINSMSATICSGSAFSITPVNGVNGIVLAGTQYNWSAPVTTGGITGGALATNTNDIHAILTHASVIAQTATYTVTPQSGICAGTSFTVTITVDPVAVIASLSATICTGSTFNVTPVNGLIPAGTTYNWPMPSVTGGLTGAVSGINTGSIFGMLINSTNATQTATYTVTPVNGSCSGTSFSVTVTVNPVAVINQLTNVICSGTSFSLTPVNNIHGTIPPGTTYSWGTPAVNIDITGGSNGVTSTTVSGTLTNTSNGAQTATYVITPSTGICVGSSFTLIVSVNPVATVTALTAVTCSGNIFVTTPTDITNGIVPAGTIFNWASPLVTGSLTGGAASVTTLNITGSLSNPSNTAQTATYLVTPVAGNCTGSAFTVTVTVFPVGVINAMTAVICSGASFTLTPVNSVNGIVPSAITYSWPLPSVTGGLTGGNSAINNVSVTGTLHNTTNAVQTATYTVTPLSGSCTGSSFTVIITVDPVAMISAMSAVVCSGDGFALTPTGNIPSATTYTWGVPTVTGGITGSAGNSNVTFIYGNLTNPTNTTQTATYIVSPLAGSCSGNLFTVIITVNPVAVVNSMSIVICSGASFAVTPTNGASGIIPAGTNYSWTTPSVTGGLTGGASGISAAGIAGTLINATNVTQTATYNITPLTGSCTGTSFSIIVTVDPVAAINAITTVTCSGTAFMVTPANTVNGIIPAGTNYSWSVPSQTGGLAGAASGVNAATIGGSLNNTTNATQSATYFVTPVAGTCAGSTFTLTVTVNPLAAVNAVSATICSGSSFGLTPTNSIHGIIPAGTIYSWSAPAVTGGLTGGTPATGMAYIAATLQNPTHVSQTATYFVTPVTGSCTGISFTVTITVDPLPVVNAMTTVICSGTSFAITPTNSINGIIPGGTTYGWASPTVTGGLSGGLSATNAIAITGALTNPSDIAQTATYVVTPLTGTCAGNPFTVTVTVNPVAVVNAITAVICSGTVFALTPANTVNDIVPAGTIYSWAAPSVTGSLAGGTGATNLTTISGSLANTTNSAQTATYIVTPLTGLCPASSFTITVMVNPVAGITALTTVTCSGSAFTITPTNANGILPAGTMYNWLTPSVTGTVTGGAGNTNAVNISGILSNTSNTAQTATYIVTPVSGTCTGNMFTVTVTLNPVAAINQINTNACSGSIFAVSPTNTIHGIVPAGTIYNWPIPAVTTGLSGGLSAAAAPGIYGTLINTTNTVQTATFSITPVSGVCSGNMFTVTVTVNPLAVVNQMTAVICSGTGFILTPADFVNGIVPAGTTYSWSAPIVTGALTGALTATTAINISGTLNNPSNAMQTATYAVTPLSGLCSGATFTILVTVNPVAVITAMTSILCSGHTFSLTPINGVNGIVPAGIMYSWASPVMTGGLTGGSGAANTNDISGVLINPTSTTQTATYTITPFTGTCAGTQFTVTVTVNPVAVIYPMTATICSGTSFGITPVNSVNGNIPPGTVYNWPTPFVTGGLTGGNSATNTPVLTGTLENADNAAQTATYTINPLSGACTGTTFTIVVTVTPVANINPATVAVCSGETFIITPTHSTNGIVPAATTYSWTHPTINGILTGAAGATGNTSITGTLVNATNTTQTATYIVTPVSGSCTGNSFTAVITVRPLPKADLVTVQPIGCSPFTIDNSIVHPVLYGGSNGTYEWYVNNVLAGTGTAVPSFILSTDTAVVTLKANSLFGCGTDSAVAVIKTHASPRPAFTVSDSTGCGPLPVTISNTTPDLSSYQYIWDLGNGQHSNLAQPGLVSYAASMLGGDTVYTVILKAYKYCDTVTVSKQIVVNRKAKLGFMATRQNNCSPLKVAFTNNSAGKQVQYHISYGDGIDSTTGTNAQYSHTYYAGGTTTYRAVLTAANTCGIDSLVVPVITLANAVKVNLALSDSVVCGNPFVLTMHNQTDSANAFTWDLGDGSAIQTTTGKGNIQYTYQSAGTYLIKNAVAGTCSDTVIYRKLIVYPGVKAVTNILLQNNCIGTAVSFNNLSNNTLSLQWIFGDGAVSDSSAAVHYFAQAGTYNTKLRVWKTYAEITCTDTAVRPLTIVSTKKGRFTLTDSVGKCLPFAVSFVNQDKPAQTKWSWGDGQVSSGDSVTHYFTSNGNFTVSMQSIQPGGCSYTDTGVIRITAPEIALQYKGGAYCQQNNSIEFTAVTTRTDSIRWEFGDGVTMVSAGSQKISHSYSRAGSFIPKLTLLNTDNCQVPVIAQDSIHIDEISAGFKLLAINDCAKTDYRFTDTSRSFFPIVKRLWTMNQNQASALAAPTSEGNEKEINQVYTKAGEYNAALEVQNRIGCKASLDAKFNVAVYEFPKANITSISDACLYNLMEIKSLVVSQDSVIRRIWNLGNGSAATDSIVKIFYNKEGIYTLSLTVGTINSCFDSVYKQLSVHPLPTLVLATDKNVCKGDSIQLKATGATGYIWKDQNDNILCTNCNEVKVSPLKNAQFKVIGYNEFGCSNITSTNVRVIQPFKLDLLASDSMCEGSSRRIVANGADNYTWLPVPGLSNYTSAVTYATPAVTTTYKVVGKDGFNCFADTASIKLVIGKPTPVNIGKDTTIIAGVPIQLNTGTLSPDIRQWQWSGKADYSCVYCASPVVKVIDDGPLTVKATNQFGCVTTDTLHVKTFCSGAEVFVPNAFTPDGDGVNDLLVLQGRGIKIVKSLRIYSRWGEMVYEKTNFQPGDKSAGWDGKVRGKLANPDVFVYLCEAVCEKGAAYTLKGNVAILK